MNLREFPFSATAVLSRKDGDIEVVVDFDYTHDSGVEGSAALGPVTEIMLGPVTSTRGNKRIEALDTWELDVLETACLESLEDCAWCA